MALLSVAKDESPSAMAENKRLLRAKRTRQQKLARQSWGWLVVDLWPGQFSPNELWCSPSSVTAACLHALLCAVLAATPCSRPCDENHPHVKPDAYVNDLAEAVDILLQQL
ncbi:hypothetical protein AAES_121694 [Amazona aestiva]|uniref:Uncharacterized protein n=1 Tax=Amazona aestiva TaxID=12930 RepID=A0A0Q3PPL9_AMAAE|nr:hypothetical protein AAES_121694 [Amazona aestiva]